MYVWGPSSFAVIERRCKVIRTNHVENVPRKTLWQRPAKPDFITVFTAVIIKVASIINDRVRAER